LTLIAGAVVIFPAQAQQNKLSKLSDKEPSGFDVVAKLADNPSRPLSPSEFDQLHALIRPQPGESRWAEVPWMTSLWEARKKAAAEGKPLFIWVISDGHPCGLC
jgi:hypothetical protein